MLTKIYLHCASRPAAFSYTTTPPGRSQRARPHHRGQKGPGLTLSFGFMQIRRRRSAASPEKARPASFAYKRAESQKFAAELRARAKTKRGKMIKRNRKSIRGLGARARRRKKASAAKFRCTLRAASSPRVGARHGARVQCQHNKKCAARSPSLFLVSDARAPVDAKSTSPIRYG